MSNILPATLGGLLSIVLVICLHFVTIDTPTLEPYKNVLALFCILLGLIFATLATPWFNRRKKKKQLSNSSMNIDLPTGDSGRLPSPTYSGGSSGGAGSTRTFSPEYSSPTPNLNAMAAASLPNTTDINPTIVTSQIIEPSSNEIISTVDLDQAAELSGELSEAIVEIVGSILE